MEKASKWGNLGLTPEEITEEKIHIITDAICKRAVRQSCSVTKHIMQFQGWLSQSLMGSDMGHLAGMAEEGKGEWQCPQSRGWDALLLDDALHSRGL